ncbi:MAG: DNA repair protein RecO [Oscillatoriaceae cyanobacterium]
MNRTYKATGINLKSVPLGEADRLVTILTKEHGLLRAVAPGARKSKSQLGGRVQLFVVNELLLHQGRSLPKITQAHTVKSHSRLSTDLGKLAAGQYLGELVMAIALSEQPQEQLFSLLAEHLHRLEMGVRPLLALLVHGIYHLLAEAGVAPQVHACCVTGEPLIPQWSHPNWRAGFSFVAGGTFSLEAVRPPETVPLRLRPVRLSAPQLAGLQHLAAAELPAELTAGGDALTGIWPSIERLLRVYAEYHLDTSIRSATLIDSYMQPSLDTLPSDGSVIADRATT